MRLDVYLTACGLAPSRTQAQAWIDGGFVRVHGNVVRKASFSVDDRDAPQIEVTGRPHPYVGRGGVKLEEALRCFGVDPHGLVCADIGASTGGFTDCLLQHGASRVFAVDSGSGQLDESLCTDSRVVNIERFNARDLCADTLGVLCDLAVADLSFISQTYVLANISAVLVENGLYIGLIKPQFECGPRALDKHGIVRDSRDHAAAIHRVLYAAREAHLIMQRLIVSPIRGGDGNREFLCLCQRNAVPASEVPESEIDRVVRS